MTLRTNAEQDFDNKEMKLVQKPLENKVVEEISKNLI
jgi:hypothetical protein